MVAKNNIDSSNNINIRNYKSEDVDYIIKIHKKLYSREYKFSSVFSEYVEKYVKLFDQSHNENKENIWIAEIDSKPVGVIAIVEDESKSAQVRWFLIEPDMRGKGLGHKLVKTALDFCKEKNYTHVFLWTADILKAARHIYKSHGFNLTESLDNTTWTDKLVKEERWDLSL
ncbi:GNAT family N-acetyltransferase [Terrisporobacter vanillatitrophus]|uniref:GNAT family N-acetyltransferase n=1 Tax=Terrisporobacter vanillatitrophus TaxID=3058402 RepID=UPI0033676F60